MLYDRRLIGGWGFGRLGTRVDERKGRVAKERGGWEKGREGGL